MTRLEGHPPAANYGPVIHLPDAYRDPRPCPACMVIQVRAQLSKTEEEPPNGNVRQPL